MQDKTEIIISPIFDQSKGNIWHDFVRIEGLCHSQHGFSLSNKEEQDLLQSLERQWNSKRLRFAFGAYDGAHMIGFANGYRENVSDMYLHNLCVVPEYQRLGIGASLLRQSENAAQLKTRNMTVIISRPEEINFYKKHGYINYDNRNLLKKLSKQTAGTIPVFDTLVGLNPKFSCRYLGKDFDKRVVQQYAKNRPLFVYVLPGCEIGAVATRTPEKGNEFWVGESNRAMVDFYKKQLERALSKAR